jgi:hypothetical protein
VIGTNNLKNLGVTPIIIDIDGDHTSKSSRRDTALLGFGGIMNIKDIKKQVDTSNPPSHRALY